MAVTVREAARSYMIPVREEEAKGRPGAVPKLSTGVLRRVWRAVQLGGAMR